MDIGLGEGCTSGKDNEVGGMVVIRDGVKGVEGEDMNDDGSEYAPLGYLHSVHESNSQDVSQWSDSTLKLIWGSSFQERNVVF